MLAFACAFTMFAGAASFTDEADINADNRDAVELLTALNIIQGYEDGSFDPDGTVTRAEMAKMIYTIRNGGNDDASAYETVTTSFTDISGHWAEGYIKYLQNTGIVAGKSATRFDPDSQVTTGEAMKMALALAGYDEEHAGLTGAAWLNNTVALATTYGLTDDVNSAIAGGCTRQDAAQILSNCLVVVIAVRYSAIVEDFVNDSEQGLAFTGGPITVGEKWMDLRVETGFLTDVPSAKVNPKGIEFVYTDEEDKPHTVTFKNAAQNVADLMGYEVKVVWNGDDVADADAIYGIYKTANNASYEAVWKDIEKDGAKVKFDGKSYKLDGNQIDVYADEYWSEAGAGTWTSAAFADKDALSDTVVFIDNDGDGELDAAQVKTQAVAQVTYVGSKNVTTKALVGNQGFYGVDYETTADLDDVTVYEGIAKDDFVKVTYDVYTDKMVYEKLDVQTGTIEATRTNNTTKEIKIDGEWLKATKGYDGVDKLSAATGDTVEYVAIGNLLYNVKKTDGQWGSNSIAMIYNAAAGATGTLDANKIMAEIIKRDGSTATVEVSKIDTTEVNGNLTTVTNVIGKIMTYRVVDGKYEFRTLDDDNNTAGFEHVKTSADPYVRGASKYNDIEIADDAFVFVIHEGADNSAYADANNSADVLTGAELKKAAGVTFEEVYANADMYLTNTTNGFNYVYGMVVGIDNDTLTTVGSHYGYLLADASETIREGNTYYRVFNLWTEAGEITAYEETGDEYEYESGTVITYEVTSVKDDITYIKSVDVPDLIIGQVTATDGNFVGLDNGKYELVNDSVILNVNTEAGTGISGGDEARGQIAEADVDAGVLNVLYAVDTHNDEVNFMLIDSVNNEILNFDLSNITASALTAALAAAEAGDTLTLTGNIPNGTFDVPEDVTVTIAGAISNTTVFNVADGAAVKVSATATGLAGKLTANVSANGAVELPQSKLIGGTDALASFSGTDEAVVAANAAGGVDVTVPATGTLTLNQNFKMSAKDNLTVNGKLIAANNGITFTTDETALPTGAGVAATTGNFYADGTDATSDAIANSKTYTYGTHTVTGGSVTGWMANA